MSTELHEGKDDSAKGKRQRNAKIEVGSKLPAAKPLSLTMLFVLRRPYCLWRSLTKQYPECFFDFSDANDFNLIFFEV